MFKDILIAIVTFLGLKVFLKVYYFNITQLLNIQIRNLEWRIDRDSVSLFENHRIKNYWNDFYENWHAYRKMS